MRTPVVPIFLALVVGGAGFFIFKHSTTPNYTDSTPQRTFNTSSSSPPVTESPQKTNNSVTPKSRKPPQGMKEYRSSSLHISLFYPGTMTVSEYTQAEGPTTVVFQNIAQGEGFQIYITRSEGSSITDKERTRDLSSGVRSAVEPITLDGASGEAFYSSDTNLGVTREVWFVRSGYLYEVTTLKSLEIQLKSVLETWQFI